MAVKFHCDICGKETLVNPPTENDLDSDGKPIIAEIRQQNSFTGKIEKIKYIKQKDLYPRAIIVKLSVGRESIQKDFCEECVKKVLPEAEALFEKLANIQDTE